jgi:hypothetical protein
MQQGLIRFHSEHLRFIQILNILVSSQETDFDEADFSVLSITPFGVGFL